MLTGFSRSEPHSLIGGVVLLASTVLSGIGKGLTISVFLLGSGGLR